MTATATSTNGPARRKQLSDQIDRMDTIIDALADALPQAVADATREGARQAVRDVLLEIAGNPDLRAALTGLAPATPAQATAQPAAPPGIPPAPGVWASLKEKVRAARDAAIARCRAARAAVADTARTLSAVMPLKTILLVGTGVGLAAGVASYLCPHSVSALVSAVGAAGTAVAAQVGGWLRRSARLLGFVGTA